MIEWETCQCPDPGACSCGRPLGILGAAAPSGRLMDRWGVCLVCDQRGRMQMSHMLWVLANHMIMAILAGLVGYWIGRH